MKIVFMGTPEFAIPSLKKIHNSEHELVAVVTGPDKPVGRGQKLKSTPVKSLVNQWGVPVLTPENLSDQGFVDELKSFSADLFVVVAFKILPTSVFTVPPKGTINLHASLLPKYRGAAPINWAIINGEKESGVTTFFIEEKVDTGEWILQKKVPIEEDTTAGELHDKLSVVGADLLMDTIHLIDQGTASPTKQTGEITKAPKITKELCHIDWKKDVHSIYNVIRGLYPYPKAFTFLNGKQFKICQSEIHSEQVSGANPGEIVRIKKDEIFVATGEGILVIKKIQPENKSPMSVAEYLRGNVVRVGDNFK